MARVFISYKRADKDIVFPLKEKIEEAIGEPCWIDLEGISSELRAWEDVIISAINEASVFLFMYSKTLSEVEDFEDDRTFDEFAYARVKKKHIVFINIDNTPLTDKFQYRFGARQQIDANSEESFNRMIRDLQRWLGVKPIQINEPSTDNESENIILETGIEERLEEDKGQEKVEEQPKEDNNDNQDDPEWQLQQGLKYYKGDGVGKNLKKAAQLFKKSAEQGNAEAQYYLGVCYYEGQGVTKNITLAKSWLQKAAEQNNKDSIQLLDKIKMEEILNRIKKSTTDKKKEPSAFEKKLTSLASKVIGVLVFLVIFYLFMDWTKPAKKVHNLTVSTKELTFSYESSSQHVSVTSDVLWKYVDSIPWVHVNYKDKNGMDVRVEKNTLETPRSAKLKVSTIPEGKSVIINITQEGAPSKPEEF